MTGCQPPCKLPQISFYLGDKQSSQIRGVCKRKEMVNKMENLEPSSFLGQWSPLQPKNLFLFIFCFLTQAIHTPFNIYLYMFTLFKYIYFFSHKQYLITLYMCNMYTLPHYNSETQLFTFLLFSFFYLPPSTYIFKTVLCGYCLHFACFTFWYFLDILVLYSFF